MVTSPAAAGILPMPAPPSLTKSLVLRSRALPTPTTTRRVASSPAGATISSADPLLPLNRSAAAALVTRSPVGLIARRAAEPNLSPSSQNRTRTPLAGVARGANSSLRAPDIGISPLDRVQQTGGFARPPRDPTPLANALPYDSYTEDPVGSAPKALGPLGNSAQINVLLCILKGFALAKPFCCGIK